MESLQIWLRNWMKWLCKLGKKRTLTLEESLINEWLTSMWGRASRNHNGAGGVREEAFAAVTGVSLLGPSIGCGGSRGKQEILGAGRRSKRQTVRVVKLVKLGRSSWWWHADLFASWSHFGYCRCISTHVGICFPICCRRRHASILSWGRIKKRD